MQLVKAVPFQEALKKLGGKSPVTSAMTSAEWSDVPVALRERAFFSSRVESARVLQRAGNAIADFLTGARESLPDGQTALKTGSRAAFVDLMQQFLRAEGVERGSGGLTDITSSARLGLIFDVQTTQANSYGYWRQGMQEDILNEFPAMRFLRVQGAVEPRLNHIPHEDKVYLKTDPIWLRINRDFGVPWAPWGWGCGHDTEDVDRREAESLGLVRPGERLKADPKSFNENLKASASGISPELLEKLKKELGDQIAIEGEEIKWSNGVKTTPHPNPLPIAPPTAQRGEGVKTAPVSAALDVKVRGTLKASVQTALDAIDQVHDDGTLPQIPVVSTTRRDALGVLSIRRVLGNLTPQHIAVKASGEWPALTAVHEVGHFLDLSAIGETGKFATASKDPLFSGFLAAAGNSAAIRGMREQAKSAGSILERRYWKALLVPEEIWARAYAQYIAEQSANQTLLADVARVRAAQEHRQWAKEDFAAVAAEITKLFQQLRWL